MSKQTLPPDFLVPVSKVPLSQILPGYQTTSPLSHAIVTGTGKERTIVNVCSKGYELLPNEKIFEPVLEAVSKNFDVELKANSRNSSKFYLDMVIKDKSYKVLTKDIVVPRVRVMNSYDGSLKFSYQFGFFRMVCSNGLMAPIKEKSTLFKSMHTPRIITQVDRLLESTVEFTEHAQEFVEAFKSMADKKLSMEEATQLIDSIVKNTKAPSKRKENMMERLAIESKMGLPISNWLVYNAINYELNHSKSNMAPHKKDKVDAEVLRILM